MYPSLVFLTELPFLFGSYKLKVIPENNVNMNDFKKVSTGGWLPAIRIC